MLVLRGPKRTVGSVDFASDGTRLAAGDAAGGVRVFDLRDGGAVVFQAVADGHFAAVAARFAPCGRQLVVADEQSGVTVWGADGGLVRTLSERADAVSYSNARGLGFTGDGRLLAARFNDEVAAWDSATWEARPPLLRAGDVPLVSDKFALEPGGHRAALRYGELLDLRADALCGRWNAAPCPNVTMAWCPGRSALAVLDYDNRISVFDPGRAAVVATFKPLTRRHVNAVAFTPDGNSLIAVGNDGVARLYDTNTWAERAAYAWKAGPLKCVAVSRDGTPAAAGGGDSKRGKVVVWDLE